MFSRCLPVSAALAMLVVVSARADEKKKDKDKNTSVIAHIKLSGDLGEAPVAESIFGVAGENLRMKLDRIKKAKKDPNVKALLVELENLEFGLMSFGKIEEVRAVIADFRQSGKKTYCYSEDFSGLEYLIACACEVVCIPQGGSFGLVGLHLEMSFYKDLLDSVKVKGDFLMMGDAKGAAEPFIRNSMSPENRKQYEGVINDFYDNGIIKTIADSRSAQKWTTDQVKTVIDEGPYAARKSLDVGLVDRIIYFDDIEPMIKKELGGENLALSKNYGKKKAEIDDNPFAILSKLMNPPKKKSSKKPKIAVIYAIGGITSGKSGGGLFGSESMGSTTLVEAIQDAEKDETVKAIVLRVDSPGGSALASDMIWHELKKSKKPIIASMGDVAASGGYYISMGCQKVYAEAGTLTGSIGVVGGKIVTGGLMNWAGVHTETLSRGKNSGVNSTSVPFSESEKKAMIAVMQDIYDQFLDKTLENRNAAGVKMTREQLLKIAGGRIWTGRKAKELGLVDNLGTLDDAIAEAKKLAKLEGEPELLILPEPSNFLDRFMEGKNDTRISGSTLLPLLNEMPQLRGHLRTAEIFLGRRNEKLWLVAPCEIRVR